MPDVGWHEEALGVSRYERLLDALGSGAPDRETAVAVMVRQHHQERPFATDEERRRPVAEPLARLRQLEADCADPRENSIPVGQRPTVPGSVQGRRLAQFHEPGRRLTQLAADGRRRDDVRLTIAPVVVLLLRPQEDLKRSVVAAALHAWSIGRIDAAPY